MTRHIPPTDAEVVQLQQLTEVVVFAMHRVHAWAGFIEKHEDLHDTRVYLELQRELAALLDASEKRRVFAQLRGL